jgi:hypothetical protein
MLAIALLLAMALALAADYAARIRAELGVDTCVPLPNTNLNCVQLDTEWRQRVGGLNYLFFALYVFPGLVASYVGGPLFAVEYERGTHRLVWTQSVSRVRWAVVKIAVVFVAAVAAAVVLAPFGRGQAVFLDRSVVSPFETFEIEGVALVSYFAFGLAVGACVGAWSRRILTGMFIGLLLFGAVRLGVHNLRSTYLDPLTVPFGSVDPRVAPASGLPADAWNLGVQAVDLQGRPVAQERLRALLDEYFRSQHGVPTATNNDTTFLFEHGVLRRIAYQPAERFWTFQVIEAAIFFALAAFAVLLTLWRVRTRDA